MRDTRRSKESGSLSPFYTSRNFAGNLLATWWQPIVAGDCQHIATRRQWSPGRCHYVAIIVIGRQRLATFSNCLKKLPSVAMVSRLWMSCQRVASESPTVVTVLQEVANTSPPGCQCFTQLCHNKWQLSGDHWRPFATWWKGSGNFRNSVTIVGNSVETIGDHCQHRKMISFFRVQ